MREEDRRIRGWPRPRSSLSSSNVTESYASGLSTLNKDQIAERGARMARRDDN